MSRTQVRTVIVYAFGTHVTKEQNRKIEEIISGEHDEGAKIDQIAKIRGWFRPQDDSAFYPIVQDYLNEKIEIDEASTMLFSPIDEKISASRLDDVQFMDLWYSIIHSARRISLRDLHKQDKVVALVAAFKNHSISENERYNYLYSSLTDFGMACREAYNNAPAAHNGFIDSEIDAWANMNYFFARVTSKDLGDSSLFAIWAMRQALETPQQDDEQATSVQKYDAYVPAAAAWAFGMGRELFRTEEDLTPTDRKQGNPARGGELWKGKAEFSKERWSFWKERFAEIGKRDDVGEKTRLIARDAVGAMKKAETSERV